MIAGAMGCTTTGRLADGKDPVETASAVDQPSSPESSGATEVPQEEWLRLRGVTVEEVGLGHRLVFDLSRTPDSVSDFRLAKPPRVVLDVFGPHDAARSVDKFTADDTLVQRIRVGHYNGRLRLVVDLSSAAPMDYTVRKNGNAVVVDLGDTGTVSEAETPAPANQPAPADQSSAPTSPSSSQPATETAAASVAPAEEAAGDTDIAADDPGPEPEVAVARAPVEPPAPSIEIDLPDPPARLTKLTAIDGKPAYTGRRISLDFKDADVQNVLRVIAEVSGLNIVATDDVVGRVTLHLTDVPWDQALDVVLNSNRLKMIREGNVVRVSTVERVREEQEELRAQQLAESELEPVQVRYIRVNYARADKALLDKVGAVLTERGSASFDERTNTIIVRDIQDGIDDAVQLIRNVDIQSPQVLIEANIVEGTTDFAQALGIQWGYRHLAGPQTGNPTGADFPGTVDFGGGGLGFGKPPPPAGTGVPQPPVPLIADFPVPGNFGPGFGPGGGSALDLALGSISGQDTLAARITALEDEGKGRIISRPRVITLNNIPARIESLTILRVRLPSTGTVVNTGTGGVAGSASSATEKIETGIILLVTPQVSADGYVLLNINAKSSQADFTRTVDEIPTEVSRQATSNVLIHDGETVVLGGIFRNEANDSETGLPYLRRVPVLGWLFKRSLKRDRKEELLVFITPQVVAGYGAELPSAMELWENRQTSFGSGGLAASYQ
jgi:type IV pilus assembly protein PilQ